MGNKTITATVEIDTPFYKGHTKVLCVDNPVQGVTIDINPELSETQTAELRQLLKEYKEIFSNAPTVTHLVKHKVELTHTEPVKCKPYHTPYKLQGVVDQEIDNMLAMGVTERSEATYASPHVLV